ncbi:glycoside hydrolase family 10 protein [Actinomadura craniellae]|nr:family 10 glycosylhydrolase [Actinomadura craniellae]
MWIATVGNIDWPSRKGVSVERQKADYRRLLDTARALNLNAVYVQVRPNSDAFYNSPYEPWSQWITGKQGRDPGYDVLDFFVREAHARNLEFHAWFNPYRISRDPDRRKLHPKSPARRHPDWVRTYGGGLWYDPGLPQVRELVTNAVMDVVRKYDIDAVHFDDYFYPYPVAGKEFPDTATFKAHGRGLRRADWRRRNVDLLVESLSGKIHAAKPWVRFGISPFGVWRNKSDDPAGSATRALASYDDVYADTRKWIRRGWVDYVTPQLYWPIGFAVADYRVLVKWWADQVAGTRVQLTIGQAAYQVGEKGPWRNPAELSRHLSLNAGHPAVRGDVYFSAKNLVGNRLGFASRLRSEHYARPAIPPVVAGRGGRAPALPGAVRVREQGSSVRVQWRGSARAAVYAVYRVPGRGARCGPVDPRRLLVTVRGATAVTDPTARVGQTYTYYVTALDRLHYESGPALGATISVGGG